MNAISSMMLTQPPGLGKSDVHIWSVDLDQLDDPVFANDLLSKDEKEKNARFRFNRDRDRYVFARATLRILLSAYLQISPLSVLFHYNKFGKPSLNQMNAPEFNISHSDRMALLAFGHVDQVGVDIEKIRPSFATTQVAQQFFSPHEVHRFNHLDDGQKSAKFFNCWTRKEAYIKAKGMGVSLPLDSFTVDFESEEPTQLKQSDQFPHDVEHFMIHPISAGDDYRAALAVSQKDVNITRFSIDHNTLSFFAAINKIDLI